MLGKQLGYALGSEPRTYEPDLVAPPPAFNDLPIGSPPRLLGLFGPGEDPIFGGDGGFSAKTGGVE